MSGERETGATAPRVKGGSDAGPGSLSWRLTSLEALLDRSSVAHTGVRAAGLESEIAVIDAPVTEVAALATLAREIRLLGFRYTTIDLAHAPGSPIVVAADPAPPEEPGRRDPER